MQNTSGRLVLICNFHRCCFSIEGSCSWLALMTVADQIVIALTDKWLNNVLIYKRQVLHKFFDNIDIFQQRFPTLSSLYKSLFKIPHYSQQIFCYKYICLEAYCQDTELEVIILRKNTDTKYIEDSSNIAFWVYFYCPQCYIWCSGCF